MNLERMLQIFKRYAKSIALIAMAQYAAGCGGNGSGSMPPVVTLVVTPVSVSATATTSDAAPVLSTIKASVSSTSTSTSQYFVSTTSTQTGIAFITQTGNASATSVSAQFRLPWSLAPGTYSDTVTVKGCYDSACLRQVLNSPQTITVTYIVTEAAGIAPVLTSLSPTVVDAGGAGFTLVASGNNFSTFPSVQWNGSPRPTTLISPNLLAVTISASDIANANTAVITVANLDAPNITVSNALNFSVSATPVTPSLIVSTAVITATTDTSIGGGALLYNPAAFAVNGATGATYYYSVSFSGSAIGSISLNGTTNTVSGITKPSGPSANRITGATDFGISVNVTGTLSNSLEFINSLTMNIAALMGAGTYSDTLSIAVCYDPLCTKPILGSPHQIAVTYVVTGNPIPITHFTLQPYALTVEAATSETLGPTATAVILASGLPPYGAYVSTTASGTAITATSFQSNLDGSGTLTVTMMNPALLGSGIYSGSVKIQICFDMACTKPANQVPFTLPVTYIVDASAGKDFTMQSIATDLTAMAWSSVNQRIYVLVPNTDSNHSNSLIVINPATATIESALPFGAYTYPTTLALSDDGQYAYVYLSSNKTIVRVLLSNLSINETLQLSSLTSLSQIAVAPGFPHTIAIADSGSTPMLSVYDDLIPRPQRFTTTSPGFFASFTWGADAKTIYVYQATTFYQVTVGSSGLSVASSTQNANLIQGTFPSIQYVGGLIYTSAGGVFNPATSSVLAPFSMQSTSLNSIRSDTSPAIDGLLNRAYFDTNDLAVGVAMGQLTLEAFNLTDRQPTWLARFTSNTAAVPLLRWGSNGLAFATTGQPNHLLLIAGAVIAR